MATLQSWGRYPSIQQTPHPCHWRDELDHCLRELVRSCGTTLPHGSGLSYGDSCLAASDHVLHLRPLDRFQHADWHNGVLRAEAGMTLSELLAVAIPRGWFLPVTPGSSHVTLGGAVANDVHGKNHHKRGCFGLHVKCLGLLRSDSGRHECSLLLNEELFRATIGGLGLTGIIEWVELQLMPIRSSNINTMSCRFGNLDAFLELSAAHDEQHEFSVAWVDCTANGNALGRGVYMAGSFADDGELAVDVGSRLAVPFTPPLSLVNRFNLQLFNACYWRKAPLNMRYATQGYGPYFYPLDGLRHWNRLYGPKGFQQFQAALPEASAAHGIRSLLAAIAASGSGSFLGVLKRFGQLASPGLLSFPQPGITIALDFPQSAKLQTQLLPTLDSIVREHAGKLYPAKDAHMSAEDFRTAYPAWQKLEALRDPALLSRFWQRVAL